MIKIDAAAIAAHPLMARLSSPPTHAQLVERLIRLGSAGDDMIKVMYRYGTIDDTGAFVADAHVDPVHALVDLSDYSHVKVDENDDWSIWSTRKSAAAANLRGAGVVPNPDVPYESIAMPAKVANDFKVCDLDAYFAHFDERLKGDLVDAAELQPSTKATTSTAPDGSVSETSIS